MFNRGLFVLGVVLEICFGGAFLQAAADDPLFLVKNGSQQKTYKLSEMKQKFKVRKGKVYCPECKAMLDYEAFALEDLLKANGFKFDETNLILRCKDGYAPVITPKKIKDLKVLLAFHDKNSKDGLPTIKKGEVSTYTGPFFVITPKSESYKEFGWPYQVVSVETLENH